MNSRRPVNPDLRRLLSRDNMDFRTRILLLLIASLALCFVSVAQRQTPEQARDALCQRVPCRPVTTVRLKLNNQEYFEMEFPKGPYVADGFINVLAGEELLVEFDETEGTLSHPHYVKTAAKPERTISLRLEQTDQGTILRVKNPLAKSIIYDCHIQHYSEQRLRKTSILPVPAGLMSFEMWPYPVAQAVISNVRYAQK